MTNTEELETAHRDIRKLKTEIDCKEDELRHKSNEISELADTKTRLERRLREAEDELSIKQTELAGLRTTVAEITSAAAGTEAKLNSYQLQLEISKKRVRFNFGIFLTKDLFFKVITEFLRM